MIVENDPKACVEQRKRGERTCAECYWSQVDERNRWTGSERCWNAQCLVAKEQS